MLRECICNVSGSRNIFSQFCCDLLHKNLVLQSFEVWNLPDHYNLSEGILYPFDAWVDTESVILLMPVQWEEKHL